jgi:putative ABC transport system permease protein
MSYTGMFVVFLGAALVIPVLALAVLRLAQLLLGALFGLPGRLAARGVAASLSRTGVAIAALAIAVAATVGVTLMITSFRGSVERWLNASIQADIYVSAPTLVGNRPDATLPHDLLARLRTVPGVAATATSRVARVNIAGAPVTLLAIDPPPPARDAFRLSGRPADMWRAMEDGAVIVSEPLSYHRGIAAGARVQLQADRGVVEVPVAGVVRDYGSSEGVVFMHRRTYERLWDDRSVSSIALYAGPGVDH